MAGPWEKYASQTDESAAPADGAGPWTKYQAQAPASSGPGFFDGTAKSAIDSLPMLGGVTGGIIGTPADAVTGPMGTLVGAGIGGYLGTATKNLINRYYDPGAAPQTTAQAITQPITGGVEQALMQGAGEAAAPYVSKGLQAGARAAKWGGTKVLSSLGGVRPDVIREYAQFSDRINGAPSIDALKDVSDQFVGKLAGDVEAKKLTAAQAQEAYKAHLSDLKDAYKTAGYNARDAVTSAQQTLKDAHGARLQQMSGDIYDTVNSLKSDIQSGSQKALDVLDASDATRNSAKGVNPFVDLSPVHSQIDATIAQLQKAGTDESLSVADKLQAYKDRLTAMSGKAGEIPATDAKKLIQGLDKITKYSPMAGAFDDVKNAAFKDIRGTLDQALKDQVPAYRKAMEPVAADASLLERVSPFGDKQSAVGLLQRINAPNQLESRAALHDLGQKYGVDFIAGAQPENLPEHALLQKAQGIQDALRPDRVAEKIDQTVAGSRQKAALDGAQRELSGAQERLAPFKPLAPNGADQTQAQQKLIALGKGGNIELTDMFQRLGKLTDTDFVQAMKDNATRSAFQKGATNGSRNTLMGALAGFAFGGVPGIATGGVAGRVVDQWGPALTKKVLDGAIQVSRKPSAQAIAALSLPEPIKRQMIIGLENYMTRGGEGALPAARVASSPGAAPTDRQPAARGEAAWAQKGAEALGITDPAAAARMMADPQARALLIQASDMKPGSQALKRIQSQLQKWSNP